MKYDVAAEEARQAAEAAEYIASVMNRDPRVAVERAQATFLNNHFRDTTPANPCDLVVNKDGLTVPRSTRYFVQGEWADVRPHLAALAVSMPNRKRKTPLDPWSSPSYRMVTDAELINRKFGRDNDQPFELWVREPDLLVIQCSQRTGNAELPNLLWEVFEGRKGVTVLVNEHATPWRSRVAYSKDLDAFLSRCAERVDIYPNKEQAP